MFQEIIDYVGGVALKHKAVNTYKYKKRSLINQQNNESYLQFIIEDNAYFQNIITQNVFTVTLNIDILGFPKDDTEILKYQNDCFQVGVEIMAYIEQDETYKNLVSIHDFDFLAISHFTDDSAAGQRLTLELVIPSPLNLCTYLDNFDEDIEIVEKPTLDLTEADKSTLADKKKELTLKPLKLRNK